jgi:hypothetical protein
MPQVTLGTTPQGLIVEAIVGVSAPRLVALRSEGKAIPESISVMALIDTGADSTMIDGSVITRLGIPSIGTIAMHTPSTGAQPVECFTFDVCLGIQSQQAGYLITHFDTLLVMESDFAAQGVVYNALIGRDVLSRGLLFYNGPHNAYTLSF